MRNETTPIERVRAVLVALAMVLSVVSGTAAVAGPSLADGSLRNDGTADANGDTSDGTADTDGATDDGNGGTSGDGNTPDDDSDDSLVSSLPLMGGGSGIAVFAVLAFVLVAATLAVVATRVSRQ